MTALPSLWTRWVAPAARTRTQPALGPRGRNRTDDPGLGSGVADLGASARMTAQLARPEYGSRRLPPATVYRLPRRVDLHIRWRRLAVLEVRTAQTAGLRTERPRRVLVRAQRRRPPHLAAEQPGEMVCLDTCREAEERGQRLAVHRLRLSLRHRRSRHGGLGPGFPVPNQTGASSLPGGTP